jgi:hypothetical protein
VPLKSELEELLGETCRRESLCERVRDRLGDLPAVTMPSFAAFRDRLVEVIQQCLAN